MEDIAQDFNKSIALIKDISLPAFDKDSYIESEIYEALSKPICNLNIEDLRILIAFDLHLDIVLKLASNVLKDNPFAEGQHYKGDLLCAVLGVNPKYFDIHLNEKAMLQDILHCAMFNIHKLDVMDQECLIGSIRGQIKNSIKHSGYSHFILEK